jgi:ribosome-binding protein aMBF1 (putative translation factor)
MIFCDLCGQSIECLQKEIDGKEYDICADCWNSLAAKLKGKGRVNRSREIVLLPPVEQREADQRKALPGEPPKIWGEAGLRIRRTLVCRSNPINVSD